MADPIVPPDAPQTPQANEYLINPRGQTVTVPHEQAEAAVRQEGFVPADQGQINEYDRVDALNGPAGMAESAALGAARSASFGLSDVGLRGMGVSPQHLQEMEDINPGSSLIGEGLGFFSDSAIAAAGRAAEAAGIKGAAKTGKFIGDYLTAPGLAGRAGEVVEGGVRSLLGTEPIDLAGQAVDPAFYKGQDFRRAARAYASEMAEKRAREAAETGFIPDVGAVTNKAVKDHADYVRDAAEAAQYESNQAVEVPYQQARDAAQKTAEDFIAARVHYNDENGMYNEMKAARDFFKSQKDSLEADLKTMLSDTPPVEGSPADAYMKRTQENWKKATDDFASSSRQLEGLEERREAAEKLLHEANVRHEQAKALRDVAAQTMARHGLPNAERAGIDAAANIPKEDFDAAIEKALADARARVRGIGNNEGVINQAGEAARKAADKEAADLYEQSAEDFYPKIPGGAKRVTNPVGGQYFTDPELPVNKTPGGGPANKAKVANLSGQFSIQNGRPVLTPFLTKATENILPAMAAGATEFGLYGVGNVISEAALQDPNNPRYDLTASGILGQIGLSGALGALGAIAGLSGSALSGTYKAGLEKLANAPKENLTAIAKLFSKEKYANKIGTFIDRLNEKAGGANPALDVQRAMDSQGVDATVRWAGSATPSQMSDIINFIGSIQDAGDRATYLADITEAFKSERDNGIDSKAEARYNEWRETQAKRSPPNAVVGGAIDANLNDTIANLNKTYEALRGTRFEGSVKDILDTITSHQGSSLDRLYEVSGKLDDLIAHSEDLPRPLRDIQGSLRETLSNESLAGKGSREFLDLQESLARHNVAKELLDRDVAEKVLSRSGNIKVELTPESFTKIIDEPIPAIRAAKIEKLQDFYTATTDLQNKYQDFLKATGRFDTDEELLRAASNKTAQATYAANAANAANERAQKVVGDQGGQGGSPLGDVGAGFAGAAIGHAASAAGHGLGGVLGGGAAFFAAKKIVPKIFKYALDNPGEAAHVLSTLYGITKTATKNIERNVAAVVSRREYSSDRLPTTIKKDPAGIRRSYNALVEDVLAHTNNQGMMIDKLHTSTAKLAQYAPNVAQALQTTAALAVNYLAAQIPQTGRAGTAGPKLEPPDSVISKIHAIRHVLDNPENIWKSFKAGTMIPELVQAVQNVYKDYYDRAAAELSVAIEAAKHPFTGTQSMMFSMFLGQDVMGSIKSTLPNQTNYAQGTAQQAPPPGNAPAGSPAASKLTLASRIAPGTTDVAQRERS